MQKQAAAIKQEQVGIIAALLFNVAGPPGQPANRLIVSAAGFDRAPRVSRVEDGHPPAGCAVASIHRRQQQGDYQQVHSSGCNSREFGHHVC